MAVLTELEAETASLPASSRLAHCRLRTAKPVFEVETRGRDEQRLRRYPGRHHHAERNQGRSCTPTTCSAVASSRTVPRAVDVTQAFVKGARARNEGVRVTGVGRTAASPGSKPPTVRSRPISWSTAAASGGARSAPWPASACRCTPASTITRIPRNSTACRPTCRSCAITTIAPTTAKMPAACWSAPSSPTPCPGAKRRAAGLRLRGTRGSYGRTVHAGAGKGDGARTDARRMRLAQLFLRPGEFYPGRPVPHGRGARAQGLLRRLRAQLGRHPDFWRARPRARRLDARRQGADGPVGQRHPPHVPVPVDPGLHRGPRQRNPGSALRKPLSLQANAYRAQPAPLAAARAHGRSTMPASARLPAGSARTGLRPMVSSPNTSTASASKTGSNTAPPSIKTRAKKSCCSTSAPFPSTWCRGATRSSCCSASPAPTSTSNRGAWFIPTGSTITAASRRI